MFISTQRKVVTDQLLKEVYLIIEAKLDDSSFDVKELASAVSMSRANLHRRLKLIIDFSPGNLIHIYRLQKAVQFLKEGYTSSQTAYRTGFESPAYFTKCFREHFGITPVQFCKKQYVE